MANNISGIETVKSFTAEELEVQKLDRLSVEYKEANAHAIRLSSAFSPLIRMAIVLGFGATLVYGGQLTLDGQMEVGVYSVLVFDPTSILPLTRLGATFDLYQRAMASVNRVFGILDTDTLIVEDTRSDSVAGDVEIQSGFGLS